MAHVPTLKQLKYLSVLAETRHFGNAAKACFVSQSTLSTAIQELETTLGAPLVERHRRTLLLTPLGEAVVQRAQGILSDVDDLVALCEMSGEPFNTRMRLGVIPTIAPFLLPPLLKALRRKHPRFRLFIREGLSAMLVDELERGDLDVLLLALPYAADNVSTQHLFNDRFVLAIPSQHPLANVKKLLTADLKGQDLLLLEDGHCLRDHAMEACKLRENEFAMPYQATSLNTIVQMVANQIGITLLPEMALRSGILSGTDVATRSFAEAGVEREIGLMWRTNSPRSEEFNLLGEFIRQHCYPG